MKELPEIATLWIGGNLSWVEQLCLKSFADSGHETTLYCYSEITNAPEGVAVADAEEIFPYEPTYRHVRTGSPAIHADLFRLNMLAKTDKVWVDADMYCYRPFRLPGEHVFGWEKPGQVCNAVIGLPKDSEALRLLLDFFADEYAIAPWLKPWQIEELEAERDAGNPVHMTAQNWGFTGPIALTYFLEKSGEIKYAQPIPAFYPLSFKERNHLILPRFSPEEQMTDQTLGVHFWARRLKPRLEERMNGVPRRGSFVHGLVQKHGIDPDAAPIPAKVKKIRSPQEIEDLQAKIRADTLDLGLSKDQLSRKYLLEGSFVKEALSKNQSTLPPVKETSHLPILDNYIHERHFLQIVHVSTFAAAGKPFVYMKNHKAACTTILATLMTHQLAFLEDTNARVNEATVHKPPKFLMKNGRRTLDVDAALEALKDRKRFRFTVVREPAARTVSAFADKIIGNEKQKSALMNYLKLPLDSTFTLSEFLDILANDTGARNLDRHWRNQTKEISYHEIDYDFIGDVSQINKSLQIVVKNCFNLDQPILKDTRKSFGHQTNSGTLLESLTKADHRNIERAFSDDLEMYQAVQKKLNTL